MNPPELDIKPQIVSSLSSRNRAFGYFTKSASGVFHLFSSIVTCHYPGVHVLIFGIHSILFLKTLVSFSRFRLFNRE